MEPRPPEGEQPPRDPEEPTAPQPAPMPWERPPAESLEPNRSTIINAEPMVTEPAAGAPEVAWAPPPSTPSGREIPGVPGFLFGSVPGRVVAWIIDNLILGLIGFVLAIIVGVLIGTYTRGNATAYNA